MRDPVGAIDALLLRLDECYDKYVAISRAPILLSEAIHCV